MTCKHRCIHCGKPTADRGDTGDAFIATVLLVLVVSAFFGLMHGIRDDARMGIIEARLLDKR